MSIGSQIMKLRIERGLTQERLAEMLEVTRQSVSKWELGQAIPSVDTVIRMSELFDVSTDEILTGGREEPQITPNPLHLGSVYLVVKDFEKSVTFYEKLLGLEVGSRCPSGNKFVEFYIDGRCLALMNESNLAGHCASLEGDYKFVLNFWVEDLLTEHERVRALGIGEVTGILEAYPTYHYFHLRDPDNNVVEVTGGYHVEDYCQSCWMPLGEGLYGKNTDGTASGEYCKYCLPNGAFSKDMTMGEMIEHELEFLDEINQEHGTNFTADEAREAMRSIFPSLKRWREQGKCEE